MQDKLIKSLQNIDRKEINNIGWNIRNTLRDKKIITTEECTALAYAVYLAKTESCQSIDQLNTVIEKSMPEEERLFVRETIGDLMDEVFLLSNKFTETDLLKYILFSSTDQEYSRENIETPESISDLALKILNIIPGDKVADFGCAKGSFLIKAFLSNYKALYYGNEINTQSKAIAKIRVSLLGENIDIEQKDMFSHEGKKFDKIFSNYPFGLRIKDLRGGMDYLNKLSNEFPGITKATSSDWIFNFLLVNSLNENGKAIGIMTNGSTWNTIDKPIREYFIKKGLIECIVALPGNLFESTSIQSTLIVLSKGNDCIKMVDGHEVFQPGRRLNSLSHEDINKIISYMEHDGELSKTVSVKEMKENDYVLNPIRYIADSIEIANAVEFGNVITKITRGAPCTASELDDMVSEEPTNKQYLMLSNIQDGMIDSNLPCLKEIQDKYKKYCIKNRSLLLSKNGAPFKVAIADVEEGREILGNGNLYIIELDEDKVDPYFLKAFFESEQGITSLKSISVGATMPNIPVEALKKMKVPVPSKEKQKLVVDKYLSKIDEIQVLKLRLAKAKNALKNIFEEVQ